MSTAEHNMTWKEIVSGGTENELKDWEKTWDHYQFHRWQLRQQQQIAIKTIQKGKPENLYKTLVTAAGEQRYPSVTTLRSSRKNLFRTWNIRVMQYLNIIQPESRNRDIKVKTFGHGNIPPYVAKIRWGKAHQG